MRSVVSAAIGLWVGFAAAGHAQTTDYPVVVELYTSQGCSSCPPADAELAKLADRDDVIALALHVDYWDYIGWKDTFGDPAFAKRQRAYAHVAGARNIFTPQMVVGGTDHLVGVHPMELSDLIAQHGSKTSPVDLTATRSGGSVHIEAVAKGGLPNGAIVQVVRYLPEAKVAIERGENAGRSVDYTNIVQSWNRAAEWDGRTALALDVEAPGESPVVVIVQEPGPGAVLAAVRLR
jgi:hypothetical protein